MSINDVAKAFTKLCADGDHQGASAKYWSDDIVSCEAMAGDMAVLKGRKAVEGKGEWWFANNEVHSIKTEGPYVNGNQFAVRFKMDITPKGGERHTMDEIALYTVRDGKVVEEIFFYHQG